MEKSYWIASGIENKTSYPKLEQDLESEICIIGGVLTGLSWAYYLTKKGFKVTILEKDKIGNHTSGNTTAKITSQHGLFYDYLIQSVGKEQARQYLYANEQAIHNIQEIIEKEKINCEFEKQDAYIFTQEEKEVENIKKEVKSVNSLGFHSEFVEEIELPISIKGGIRFPNQAQFNPYLYMLGLAQKIIENGGKIYEDTKVMDVKKQNEDYEILTENARVTSRYVIIASHYPFLTVPGFYFMKMYQEASYIVAVEDKNKTKFEGMYINVEKPTLSVRRTEKGLILIGGSEHKTGEKIDLKNAYLNLENKAKQLFPETTVKYRWNTQDCISLDKIPYIGEFSKWMPNVYVATGYKKWGMTTSNVAANILVDKIIEKENPYQEVFRSTRLEPIKNYQELTNMTKEVTQSFLIEKLKKPDTYVKNMRKEEGKIIEINGQKVGAYCDMEGRFHFVKPICTHLGCELTWNNLDKTWDCPCHGSRFDYDGKSIYDPSIKNLEKL